MGEKNAKLSFLASRPVRIASLLLAVEVVLFYGMPTSEKVPLNRPLKDFPSVLNGWRMTQEIFIEEEVQEVLKADDTLDRFYSDSTGGRNVNLFVVFFKSQRAGVSPHSPKVCLPGAGWVPQESKIISIVVPGHLEPIRVNRYVVARENQKSLVFYWYQSHGRVVANEYAAKLYLMLDSIRRRRSDTSMIRVMVPIGEEGEATAEQTAAQFIRDSFHPLQQYLPI